MSQVKLDSEFQTTAKSTREEWDSVDCYQCSHGSRPRSDCLEGWAKDGLDLMARFQVWQVRRRRRPAVGSDFVLAQPPYLHHVHLLAAVVLLVETKLVGLAGFPLRCTAARGNFVSRRIIVLLPPYPFSITGLLTF